MNDGSWAIVIQSQENDFVIQREFDLTAGGEATAVVVTVRTRCPAVSPPTGAPTNMTHEDHPNCDCRRHEHASWNQQVDNPSFSNHRTLTLF